MSPWVTGRGYLPDYPEATVSPVSEHHAIVTLPAGTASPAPGSVLAVVPNHACTAVKLVDHLAIAKDGAAVNRWPVAARGAHA
ncbi:hypothetical protein ACH4FX_35010 [Streptomyces sp. NPDC018019]|uniref:hypothetical protein n=1 Tax=Streptomyces sp. NPDC018019 TaxID=3365030 RepID=UPI0037A39EE0